MKKLLLSMLVVSFLLATLTACGAEAKQPDEPEPQVEKTEPVKAEPLAEQNDNQELSGAALEEYFQLAYDACSGSKSSSNEQISFELEMIESFCYTDKKVLPSDYADQYRAWRPGSPAIIQTTEAEAPQTSVAAFTFNDVNETTQPTSTTSNTTSTTQNSTIPPEDGYVPPEDEGYSDNSNYGLQLIIPGSEGTGTLDGDEWHHEGSLSDTAPESKKGSTTQSEDDNYAPPSDTSYTYDEQGFHGIVDLTQVDSFGTIAGDVEYQGTLSDTAP